MAPIPPLQPPIPISSQTVSRLTLPWTEPPSTPTPAALLSTRNSVRVATAPYGKLPTPMQLVICSRGLAPTPTCPPARTHYFLLINTKFLETKTDLRTRRLRRSARKSNPKQVRWTTGGDKVEYTGNITTQTADIQTAKCLFNSVVSTPNGRFVTLDLKDF